MLQQVKLSWLCCCNCTAVAHLDSGFRRRFTWRFTIVNVETPIIGAGFLTEFDLLVDLKRSQIVDDKIKFGSSAISVKTSIHHMLNTFKTPIAFENIPKDFKDITNFIKPVKTFSSEVEHHSSGPPISTRPRREHPGNL